MNLRIGKVIAAGLVVAGLSACEPDPEAAGNPCVQEDPAKRGLAGSYVRQQIDTPSFQMLAIGGDVRRNGRLSLIVVGDYSFDARIDRETEGAFKAARQSSAVPVEALTGVADKVLVYDLTYKPSGGPVFQGKAVLGPPTPPSQIAASGAGAFSGPVLIEAAILDPEAPPTTVKMTGQATVSVQYGSRRASVVISGLAGDGPLPFAAISWTGLSVCGARLVSSGLGGVQILDADNGPVNFAGASDAAPTGSAVLDSRFFGTTPAGLPSSIGGAVLIQGDTGIISAVFVAGSSG